MCTSILQIAKDGSHILARTMDWHVLAVQPLFVPRGYQWESVYDNRVHTNRYAMIGGGGAHHHEIDVSDGVNEMGLSVQKLTFANGSQLVDEPTPGRVQLAPYEFSFYLLGHYASVADIEGHLDEIQLMTNRYAVNDIGHAELHFAVVDRTGRTVVIEPTHFPLRVRENPLGVVTNSKDFDLQLERLGQYVNFTEAFKQGKVPLNTPRVTTGKFSGKPVPSGSFTPGGRFVRAAYYKERADIPVDETTGIISAWHLLDSVTVPQSHQYRPTYSVYRAATVCESLTYYFQPYNRLDLVQLTLTPEMLSWTAPKFYPVANDLQTTVLN
ncbi:linear amide C-N hydrolase [Levilactobacillus brevis]|uniref:linear amide C-N hydrolase n=1 Tax=Levilactobacillus TaxID=2767886 RepID=UPI001141E08C|nr:linear amide C-N hydrolase [Levilactobacillus brevis]MBL3536439.1 linear amide C-N hydrolase [Lactobacillus sp. GPR40-2]MBL3629420.1 linear amide C-N hydrolase [Lactobacillus sp. GPB7-4]MCB5231809.1 linear amide C-N hydrolase [Levilactobacillus brevis]MCX7510747.1 linear amide C-N hydrolase [Levilactobacillus brevis]MUV40285.1 linear amide C-N hydrolase [Levilactobacillus brevis]